MAPDAQIVDGGVGVVEVGIGIGDADPPWIGTVVAAQGVDGEGLFVLQLAVDVDANHAVAVADGGGDEVVGAGIEGIDGAHGDVAGGIVIVGGDELAIVVIQEPHIVVAATHESVVPAVAGAGWDGVGFDPGGDGVIALLQGLKLGVVGQAQVIAGGGQVQALVAHGGDERGAKARGDLVADLVEGPPSVGVGGVEGVIDVRLGYGRERRIGEGVEGHPGADGLATAGVEGHDPCQVG